MDTLGRREAAWAPKGADCHSDHLGSTNNPMALIAGIRERLDGLGPRIAQLRQKLRDLHQDQPEYDRVLSHLHALERSFFSQRLELEALCRDRRREAGGAGRRELNPRK